MEHGRTMGSPTEKQAIGIRDGKLMKLVCAFDVETWEDVRARAVQNKISVAEQVRRLVEIGLEGDGIEEIARKADKQAAAYEQEAVRSTQSQQRIVPEPQLSQLKATHWRILAKFIRGQADA